MADDKPKIQIDSDWKAEAQAEKQRLSEQVAEAADGGEDPRGLPPANFQTLISGFVSQALLYMGAIPDPQTGQGIIHLDMAKHSIDMLAVVEEKTKGNITEDEAKMLKQAIHELRMTFVDLSKRVAEHMQKQAAEKLKKPGGPAAGGGIQMP